MNVSINNLINNKGLNPVLSSKNNKSVPKFSIDDIKQEFRREEAAAVDIEPIENMEKLTGKFVRRDPSYEVTDEEAKYFREKYGEEYDEENPYQLFYELADKNIISADDAASASGFHHLTIVGGSAQDYNKMVTSGNATDFYSDYTCFGRYYYLFKRSYDKEISTWQDIADRQLDFYRYLTDIDEELLTPDGTHFGSGKDEMNCYFGEACGRILKVKDVLGQIFG